MPGYARHFYYVSRLFVFLGRQHRFAAYGWVGMGGCGLWLVFAGGPFFINRRFGPVFGRGNFSHNGIVYGRCVFGHWRSCCSLYGRRGWWQYGIAHQYMLFCFGWCRFYFLCICRISVRKTEKQYNDSGQFAVQRYRCTYYLLCQYFRRRRWVMQLAGGKPATDLSARLFQVSSNSINLPAGKIYHRLAALQAVAAIGFGSHFIPVFMTGLRNVDLV